MTLLREKNELVLRIPEHLELPLLEAFIEYIRIKEILAKSGGTEAEANAIVNEIETDWWKNNRTRFLS
jgi:hypothetical protein